MCSGASEHNSATSSTFCTFVSDTSNIVPGHTNVAAHVFRFERQAVLRTVSGIVRFGHASAEFVPPSVVQMRVTWNGVPYGVGDCMFALALPAGRLTLSTRHLDWLRRTVVVDATLGDIADVELVLVNGDANLDDTVNLLDPNAEPGTFGLLGGPSDLDEDGMVALPGLLIVFVTFGSVSEP
ncbi:MAG: hypothetical protein HRF45_13965 [Fimbriimonadia bacterium]